MKRATGTGSVYKLKGNRRKPWAAVKTVGWDRDGNRLRKRIGYFITKAEAEKALSLDEIRPASELAGITLEELYEEWQSTREYTDLSKSTQDGYDAAYKYLERFKQTRFADLRQKHFQVCIDAAAAMGRKQSTQNKIKILCGILSKYAMVQDIVYKSYAVKLRTTADPVSKIPIFSDIDIKKMKNNVSAPMIDTILILIYTGMRISEMLTLTKFQVDIDEMLIVGGVKTDAGKDRIIPIHPCIQDYVKKRYAESKNYLIEWEDTVGSNKKGTLKTLKKPYTPNYYRKKYYEALDVLGIARISPHKARHTFFSMMDAKCKDKKAMAEIGGHTDPNFSEKVYVHPDIERLRKAINSI